jgi:probable phosphoglycerate mutase
MAATPGEAASPADRTLIYLVRHGQTPLNESGVLRGLLDPPLDEAGHQQARRLAAVLGPQMPAPSSPAHSCEPRRPHNPSPGRAGLDMATDERLLDRDYGQWTGDDREKWSLSGDRSITRRASSHRPPYATGRYAA